MKPDLTLEDVEANKFLNHYKHLIRGAWKYSEFDEFEATFILAAYYKFAAANNGKYISKSQFLTLLEVLFHLYDKVINERIVAVIEPDAKGNVKPESWVRLFDIYLSQSMEKKMRLCYKVYDLNNSGMIERVECVQPLVQNFIITDDEDIREEMHMEWTELIMKRMDRDKDGSISYDDYSQSVRLKPTLMQFLGIVLPDLQVAREVFPTRPQPIEKPLKNKRAKTVH